MPAKVRFIITRGPLTGQTFTFAERTTCILGRGKDCEPRLPNDQHHLTISRYHCLLDINPPAIRVRDFGSLNGTFVNGTKIGQRSHGLRPQEVEHASFREVELHDGDEVRLDHTVLRVRIEAPARCISCGQELAEAEAQAHAAGGAARCATCQARQEQGSGPASSPRLPRRCAGCGQDLPVAASGESTGAAWCSACRVDGRRLIQKLFTPQQSKAHLQALGGYTVLKELGRGGMGMVYLVRHEATGEQMALKVLLPQGAATTENLSRFRREAELTRALRHRHLVSLRELGEEGGVFFFTMDYCPGGSLRERLQQHGGSMLIDEACGFILQALDGLHYAHTARLNVMQADGTPLSVQGVVHRDLKPANLLLTGSGGDQIVKIGDFGLAKAFELAGLSGLSRTGELGGTPYFMPRQLVVHFKYAQPAADVWALAASLYHMLTGAFPRDFPPQRDHWLVVLQSPPVPIHQRCPTIPKRLAAVIDHALVDQPEIGFQTALEFKQALEGAL